MQDENIQTIARRQKNIFDGFIEVTDLLQKKL